MEGRVAETKWYWYLWLVSLVTTLGSARETSFYVQSERIGKNWRQRKKRRRKWRSTPFGRLPAETGSYGRATRMRNALKSAGARLLPTPDQWRKVGTRYPAIARQLCVATAPSWSGSSSSRDLQRRPVDIL